ncbi:SRPBCC family protein [Anatilimnocola floriformis]|uniref:SRPBCC family protein n=1 Tax=Anatilimnocola floriformis TaxID=2948575 RepID=UPI0020C2DD4E|nr:SRPBCC family protein [Anatilimnocola floriformis]
MPRSYTLVREQFIPLPLDQVFPFFADAGNLQRITPPWLNFKILTPLPLEMKTGALLDYQISLFGVPMKWKTRIEEFTPQERFVDVQLRGPYRVWHHTHEFTATADGTQMRDTVRYEMPFGPLGTITHALMVRHMLKRIFDYRFETIERELVKR